MKLDEMQRQSGSGTSNKYLLDKLYSLEETLINELISKAPPVKHNFDPGAASGTYPMLMRLLHILSQIHSTHVRLHAFGPWAQTNAY